MAPNHRYALKALAVLGLAAAFAVLAVLYTGAYDVTALAQHTRPVHWVLDTGMRQAVRMRSRDVVVPPLDEPALSLRGFQHFRDSCLKCHGAPGIAPEPFARGLLPLPNSLAQTALEWTPAELYWVTRNGLKMTGMPAWAFRYPDEELWAIVAFVKRLPTLTAADYAALDRSTKGKSASHRPDEPPAAGDARRGSIALQQYACATCHRIPGIVGAAAHVGPPLEGIANRKYLGGRLPNTAGNMVHWIRNPKAVNPATLMPDLEVTESHARDIAAYLATLD